MFVTTLVRWLLLALFATPLLAGPQTGGELNLEGEIRAGVRWLRSVQDVKDGSYGGGVTPTAWALRAFAECPDRYRAVDGPFVRRALDYLGSRQDAQGLIADAGSTPEQQIEQTRLAAATLAMFADASTANALKAALKRLSSTGLAGPGWDAPAAILDAQAAEQRAREWLGRRDRDGIWTGKQGSVVESSRALIELSFCERVLKKSRAKAAAPKLDPLPTFAPADAAKSKEALIEGGKFLAGLAPDGKFGQPGKPDAGVSALALGALLCVPEPRPAQVQKAIDSGLAWLVTLQHPDGSIHDGKLANYGTSAAIMALVRARNPEYAPVIAKAQAFLQLLQADEGEGYSEGDLYYGGIGYGGSERPDLSNLQMALEALSASGLQKGDPTYTKALSFLQRCQNRSESNDVRVALADDGRLVIKSGDDGGAGYAPGDSKAGFVQLGDGNQVPRSYGSMSYALLKSFVFAGLDREDPRVKAAWEWCRKNYTLDINPGFVASEDPSAAYQGLYYYFHSMARALEVFGDDTLVDAQGKSHAWRSEICGRLIAMQDRTDGSWINRNSPRWYEGNPVVATAYALLTLDAARPR